MCRVRVFVMSVLIVVSVMFFFSSRRRHTRCALVTGVQTCALPIFARSQLDTQRAVRDAANARVAQVRAQLGERVIRAPFAGTLGIRQVSPGALVTPGTPIATLDDLSRMFVDFPMPETALSRIAAGQHVSGRVRSCPGSAFAGIVATLDTPPHPGQPPLP